MNADAMRQRQGPALFPTTRRVARAVNEKRCFLLHHLLKEALYARNRELDKLHRIHDLMLSPELQQPSAALALEKPRNSAACESGGKPTQHHPSLHAVKSRDVPAVKRNSLASLQIKTILAVLLERLHSFVPYRAALIRLGDGTNKRPLQTVARRVCDLGTDDTPTRDSYERLVDAAFKAQSALTTRNDRQKYGSSGAFAVNDSMHWRLSLLALAGRKALGTLSIFFRADTSLGQQKIKLLDILAAQTAKVIQRSLVYDRIRAPRNAW